MGFFDALKAADNYFAAETPKKWEAICKKASDYKLQEWWDEKKYDPTVDQRIKDVAEKELRRRGLNY